MATDPSPFQSTEDTTSPIGHNKARYRDMPPAVYGLFAGIWAGLVVTYWAIFGAQLESGYMIGISTIVYLACAGLPIIILGNMMPKTEDAPRLSEFIDGEVETFTGRMEGVSALVQVLIIPVALTTATIIMGVILAGIR